MHCEAAYPRWAPGNPSRPFMRKRATAAAPSPRGGGTTAGQRGWAQGGHSLAPKQQLHHRQQPQEREPAHMSRHFDRPQQSRHYPLLPPLPLPLSLASHLDRRSSLCQRGPEGEGRPRKCELGGGSYDRHVPTWHATRRKGLGHRTIHNVRPRGPSPSVSTPYTLLMGASTVAQGPETHLYLALSRHVPPPTLRPLTAPVLTLPGDGERDRRIVNGIPYP